MLRCSYSGTDSTKTYKLNTYKLITGLFRLYIHNSPGEYNHCHHNYFHQGKWPNPHSPPSTHTHTRAPSHAIALPFTMASLMPMRSRAPTVLTWYSCFSAAVLPALLAVLLPQRTVAIIGHVAVPVMGFSTWNYFEEAISETLIHEIADSLARVCLAG